MGSVQTVTATIKPEVDDFDVLRSIVWDHIRAGWGYRALNWSLFALYGVIMAAALEFAVAVGHIAPWAAVLACVYPVALAHSAAVKACEPLFLKTLVDPNGMFLAGYVLEAGSEGFHMRGSWGEAFYRWTAVLRVRATPRHIILFVDRASAVLIPKRSFVTSDEANRFVSLAQSASGERVLAS